MSGWLPLLHFQRPYWLWALLVLPLLWIAWRRRRGQDWRALVDPHLRPALLVPCRGRAWLGLAGASLAMVLAVLALAGPGWRQAVQPRAQSQGALVVALDLSTSILTADLPPSRLAQARAKLARLLARRAGGEVALVAWAADAYTVTPLTADVANVALFLDALAPEVMPGDGHHTARAITHAAGLLRQAGFPRGQILLLTSDAESGALPVAAATAAAGYQVSVLGLGTSSGAMHRDARGLARASHRDDAALQALAAAGQGRYAVLSVDDSDLLALGVLEPEAGAQVDSGGARVWLDQGYWLLPPLLLLAALAFRRGAALLALPLLLWMLPAGPATAAGDGAWLRGDQQAQRQLERGVEAYRRGDFDAAAEAFAAAGARGAAAQYNLGNALARQGRYDEAIAAYDRALAQAPGMQDAVANRRVVEAARRAQPPAPGGGGSGGRQPPPGDPSKGAGAGQGDPGAGQPRRRQGQEPAAPPPGGGDTPPPASEDPAAARERQARADREQRQRMQQALQQARGDAGPQAQPGTEAPDADPQARERRQAHEAWLRRVPDDPGGLLRAKFQLEQQRRQQEGR